MSPEGYDDETEEKIYNWFMKLMNRGTYDIINPIYKKRAPRLFSLSMNNFEALLNNESLIVLTDYLTSGTYGASHLPNM